MVCAILTVGRSSGFVTQHKGHSGVSRKGMAAETGKNVCQAIGCVRSNNASLGVVNEGPQSRPRMCVNSGDTCTCIAHSCSAALGQTVIIKC
jgi:hypothetical protein